MKKIKPTFGVLLVFFCFAVSLLAIIGAFWIFLGMHYLTICISVVFGLIILIMPFTINASLRLGAVEINEYKVIYWEIDKTKNNKYFLQEIALHQIQEVKVVNNEEIKTYDKSCKAKKVLLFDLGGNGVKYIIITLFTKRQIQEIIQTITDQQEKLKTSQSSIK